VDALAGALVGAAAQRGLMNSSPRTVQSHLYRIFPKLGITARNQLRDTFA